MLIRLRDDNSIQMLVKPDSTDIVISCAEGQNQAIERFILGIGKTHQSDLYDLQIERKKEKRSRNANSYMWVISEKIAQKISSTREDVYRSAIRQVGVFSDVAVQTGEPLASLVSFWNKEGIGWFTDVFDSKLTDNRGNEMKRVRLYKGSSIYNTNEMSRLIDYIVSEAKNLGIETETPDEIEKMKAMWGEEV